MKRSIYLGLHFHLSSLPCYLDDAYLACLLPHEHRHAFRSKKERKLDNDYEIVPPPLSLSGQPRPGHLQVDPCTPLLRVIGSRGVLGAIANPL